ncbi:MAG: phytanoyl-CoA dioxygenase family protein [Gammaproteobacteria bacterium]
MLKQNDLYPTRGDYEFLSERKDPILYGWGGDGCRRRLSDTELVDYEKNGFVIIPKVFSAREIESLTRRLPRLRQQNKREKHRYWRRDIPPGESETLFAPEKSSALFHNLARESRILDRVRQVLGGSVYLHRSRIHIENSENDSFYPWHSEFESWHAMDGIPRMRGAEAWIMLSENTPTNGAMRMLAKSHYIFAACQGRNPSYDAVEYDSRIIHGLVRPSAETLTRLLYFGELVEAFGEPGTLVICDSNLMYGSSNAAAGKTRATAMFSYNSVDNIPLGPPFSSERPRQPPLVNRDLTPLKSKSFDLARPVFANDENPNEQSRKAVQARAA